MLRKLQKNKTSGFTIIEVMIVLAIAGLILLIVFLAVPALQRNSRNTQRKNDVAALLAGVSEFVNNNNGTLPTSAAFANGAVTFGCGGGTCTTSEAKVGYFNRGIGAATGQVNMLAAYAGSGPYTTAANDRVTIDPAAGCAATNASVAGSARQLAAIYEVESGTGSYAGACQES
jgi:prepilin-type N-terminal cleavage/methylation domain-containing protein